MTDKKQNTDPLIQPLNAHLEQQREMLPTEEELRALYQSDLFDQSLQQTPIIGKRKRSMGQRIGRMAASVAVASVMVFSGLMTSLAFREQFLQFLFDVTSTHTTITIDDSTEEAKAKMDAAAQNQMVYKLTWLPPGFELEERSDYHTMIIEQYFSPAGDYFSFDQFSLYSSVSLDTENAAVVKHITVGGYECLFVRKQGITQVLWQNDDAILLLCGENMTEATILRIAEGVSVHVEASRRYSPAEQPIQVGWVPQTVSLVSQDTPSEQAGIRTLEYEGEGIRLIITQQRYTDAQWPNWEDWEERTDVDINQAYGLLLSQGEQNLLFWDDYRFLYTISSHGLTPEEQLEIAQSITLPQPD